MTCFNPTVSAKVGFSNMSVSRFRDGDLSTNETGTLMSKYYPFLPVYQVYTSTSRIDAGTTTQHIEAISPLETSSSSSVPGKIFLSPCISHFSEFDPMLWPDAPSGENLDPETTGLVAQDVVGARSKGKSTLVAAHCRGGRMAGQTGERRRPSLGGPRPSNDCEANFI